MAIWLRCLVELTPWPIKKAEWLLIWVRLMTKLPYQKFVFLAYFLYLYYITSYTLFRWPVIMYSLYQPPPGLHDVVRGPKIQLLPCIRTRLARLHQILPPTNLKAIPLHQVSLPNVLSMFEGGKDVAALLLPSRLTNRAARQENRCKRWSNIVT